MRLALLLLAAAAPPNLVPFSGFSTGIFEPEGWTLNISAGNQVLWVCDRGDPSRCALQLRGSGQDWAGASSGRIAVRPGETLTVAAWVQSDGADPGRDRLFVRFFRGMSFVGQMGPAIPAASSEWAPCAGRAVVPEGCDGADVSLQVRSRGVVLLGAVGLFRASEGDASLLPQPAAIDPVPVTVPRGLPPDANRNGLADSLERFLGIPHGARTIRQARRPTTCFQTPTGYRPDNDLKVDAILVVSESRPAIASWQAMGYESYFMTGFRAGPEYVATHPGSAQQDRHGRLLDCGPGSYYMVPTEDRRRILREQFRTAFLNGAEAAAPEEPEFIGSAGYSPAFQAEFQAHYGRPWVPPHTSPQARVDCQRLMGHLQVELLRACYAGARSVNEKAPAFLLCHSPLNYSAWGIMFPHHEAITRLKVDQMIAQVWTGTARSPTTHQGVSRERTFENAYLEYSSCLNLVRGMPIPVWLLMDPVEDNPDRPMEDYFRNYKCTLGAALMFPETDRYEVMPWPTRIFGRVPPEFATVICTAVNALSDIQHYPRAKHDRGTTGIASFLADSAMWQRHEPEPSDFDAVYGLTLPLLMRGVPVELAHLDRVADPHYLDRYRVLLVSFDAMKPQRKAQVDAIAAWVRRGGSLLLFGGQDAYNDLAMWWKDEGFSSPHAYLLKTLGMDPSGMRALGAASIQAPFRVVARTDYIGRTLENRGIVALDVTEAIARTGAALIRFEDTLKEDGWGPWIASVRLVGTRQGKPLDVTVRPGTPQEGALIASDTGSGIAGEARFVDAERVLVYRVAFDPGTQARVELDVGNQYCISVAPAPAAAVPALRRRASSPLARAVDPAALSSARLLLAYPRLGGSPALTVPEGAVLTEAAAGRGRVVVCGVPPSHFTRSPAADQILRSLVRYVCGRDGGPPYREQGHVGIARGPYVVVRTLEGSARIPGPAVDLMSPDLVVRDRETLGPDDLVILKRLPRRTGRAPVIAASSACVEWARAQGNELRLVASGPAGTPAVMRLVTGGRRMRVSARDGHGREREVRVEPQGATALLRFDSVPQGLGIRVVAE